MLSEYEEWVTQSMEELQKSTPEEIKVRDRIKAIKQSKLGLRRQEAMYRMFKEYISHKPTSDQAKQIIDKSSDLRVDASNESLYLDRLLLIIEQFEQEYERI